MYSLYIQLMRKKGSHLKTLISIGCVIVLTNIFAGFILYVALVEREKSLIPYREFIFAIVVGAIAYLSWKIFRNQPNLNGAIKLDNSKLSDQLLQESRYQLYRVVRDEIEKRLYEKIPKQGLMELEISETDTLSLLSNPDRLSLIRKKFSHTNCFWVCPDKDNNLLAKLDTKIYNIFHTKQRKLLILGDAGSGKTTMVQKLAQILLNRFTPDNEEPIPVIFELTYWNPNHSIQDWLVQQLKSKYNLQKDIAEYWLNTGQIVPILDNLDEQTKARKECRIAINNFLNQKVDVSLVVCCRLQEYSKIDTRLQLSVIELKPLPLKEIRSYLSLVDDEKKFKLWNQIKDSSDFKKYARFPLYVKLISDMNESLPVVKKPDLISQDAYRKYYCDCLLNQYIEHQLAQDKGKKSDPSLLDKPLKKENAEKWLIWLAKTLEEHRIKDFFIERIQPNWLKYEPHLLRRYFIAYGISSGLIFGLISAAISSLFEGKDSIVPEIVTAIISALISVLIHGQVDEIILFEEFQISWDEIVAFWKNPIQLLFCAFIPIIISQIFLQCFIHFLPKETLNYLGSHGSFSIIIRNYLQLVEQFTVIIPVFTTILITVVFSGRKTEIKNIEVPNQGVKDSFVSAIIFMITGTTIVFSLHLIISHSLKQDFDLKHSIVLGLSIGTLVGLLCGGFATIQHYILRLILCWSGFAPWDYPKFLANVAERGLILQRGGRYCFVHQLIREKFVQM